MHISTTHGRRSRDVKRVLHPDEKLLWSGYPEPGPYTFAHTSLVGCLGVASIVGVIVCSVLGSLAKFALDGDVDVRTERQILGLATIVGFASIIWWPVWNYFEAMFTTYAITDERCIISQTFAGHVVTSYPCRSLVRLRRRDSGKGVGSISFTAGSASGYECEGRFFAVAGIHDAERCLLSQGTCISTEPGYVEDEC